MKITQADDEMYRSNMFSKEELVNWEEKNKGDKTWVHLRAYFKNIYTVTMGYQGDNPCIHGFKVPPARKREEASRQDAWEQIYVNYW